MILDQATILYLLDLLIVHLTDHGDYGHWETLSAVILR